MDQNETGYGIFCRPWPFMSYVAWSRESSRALGFHATQIASKPCVSLRLPFPRLCSVKGKVCACIQRRSKCIYLAYPIQECRCTSRCQDIIILDSYLHCFQVLHFRPGLPFRKRASYGDGCSLPNHTSSHCRIFPMVKWNWRTSQP